MISFDLKCDHGHIFEGWFRSSAGFEDQAVSGQIECPFCGSRQVGKAVMAPAVAAKTNRRGDPIGSPVQVPMATGPGTADHMKTMLNALAEAQTRMLAQSEWVGDNFADRARAMHYGDADSAPIHGTTNVEEARAMMEEGLPVAPLLVPVTPPDQAH